MVRSVWASGLVLALCACSTGVAKPLVPYVEADGGTPFAGLGGDPDAGAQAMPMAVVTPPVTMTPPPTPPTMPPPATVPLDACPAGSIDLGAMSTPNATTVVELGTLPAHEPITAFGGSAHATATIALCAPSDAVSFLVSWERNGWLPSLISPFDGQLIDATSGESYRGSPAGFGDGAVRLPIVPSQRVANGTFLIRFGAVSTTVTPSIAIRRGDAGKTLPLNLIYVDSALTADDYAQFDAAFASFSAYFATLGVTVGAVAVGTIRDRALEIVDVTDDLLAEEARASAAVTVYGDHPLRDDAVAIYVVREIDSSAPTGGVLGGFSPVTGRVPNGRLGTVISSVALRGRDGRIQASTLYYTLAHELGHYLGLRHTTESSGAMHDLLTDTVECDAASDWDRDGFVTAQECAGHGADNLMFWNRSDGAFQVSPDQIRMLTSSPVLRGS